MWPGPGVSRAAANDCRHLPEVPHRREHSKGRVHIERDRDVGTCLQQAEGADADVRVQTGKDIVVDGAFSGHSKECGVAFTITLYVNADPGHGSGDIQSSS